MQSLLVDTDVASFSFKHDSRAELYRPILDGVFLFISFMSLAELDLWSIQANWGDRKRTDFAHTSMILQRYIQTGKWLAFGPK